MDNELQEWRKLHEFYMYSGDYQTKELATFVNVSERTIQRWLKEKTKPNEKQLAMIGRYLESKKRAGQSL